MSEMIFDVNLMDRRLAGVWLQYDEMGSRQVCVGVVWVWCGYGCGVGVVWVWCGYGVCGVCVAWVWCGVGVVWVSCGCGVGVVWVWCRCGVGVVWLWCGWVGGGWMYDAMLILYYMFKISNRWVGAGGGGGRGGGGGVRITRNSNPPSPLLSQSEPLRISSSFPIITSSSSVAISSAATDSNEASDSLVQL